MDVIRSPLAPPAVGPLLARLFDQARDFAVILLDIEGRIASWPRAAQHVFGYTPEDTLGRSVSLLFTEEDRQVQAAMHELATAHVAGHTHDDRWHQRKDGSRFWASGAMVALVDDDGTLLGFGKIIRDRTDLRTQVVTLKNRLAAELQERERKDAFLATLAHELRNPLAPLSNAAQLIRLTADEESLRLPLGVIDRQIAFMQRMVDDLMDLTRLRVGKLQLNLRVIVLQDALVEALEAVAAAVQARGQRLQPILPQPPIEIELDPDRFQQIVVNLLGNAIKYTPAGGTIWVKAMVETGHAVVRVEDTGSGIPAELQPRLFDLFTQGEVDGTRRRSGLGIGLALVKSLCALHNGTIAVRSEGPGKGSEFTVRLPLRQPPPDGMPRGA